MEPFANARSVQRAVVETSMNLSPAALQRVLPFVAFMVLLALRRSREEAYAGDAP
jgi:hypothetical protein